jgi:hypothetical protein
MYCQCRGLQAALRREDARGAFYDKHSCQQQETQRPYKWFLLIDPSLFHVFVVAVAGEERVRFDWDDENRLKAGPYVPTLGETVLEVGDTGCCVPCCKAGIAQYNQHYQLFSFNCRTVSFLLLTQVKKFPVPKVSQLFLTNGVVCGLDRRECFTARELRHLLDWIEAQKLGDEDEDSGGEDGPFCYLQ